MISIKHPSSLCQCYLKHFSRSHIFHETSEKIVTILIIINILSLLTKLTAERCLTAFLFSTLCLKLLFPEEKWNDWLGHWLNLAGDLKQPFKGCPQEVVFYSNCLVTGSRDIIWRKTILNANYIETSEEVLVFLNMFQGYT